MKKLNFTKMLGSGNDFIVVELKGSRAQGLKGLAAKICDRKYGAGADGMLALEKSKTADIKMRVFNPDGSEAEMCGNGARVVAFWASKNLKPSTDNLEIETMAGIITAKTSGDNIKIKLTNPKALKLDIPLEVNGRSIKVNFINTGVPHAVVFVNGIDNIDVVNIGGSIRRNERFAPAGANVNFVEIKGSNQIRIRTYERGVEDETLACGTGSAAAALIFALKNNLEKLVRVKTQSGEQLKVYFKKEENKFQDVWLEGSAKIVYKGEYYV